MTAAKGVSQGRHLQECCLIENSKLKREEEEEEEEASLAIQDREVEVCH